MKGVVSTSEGGGQYICIQKGWSVLKEVSTSERMVSTSVSTSERGGSQDMSVHLKGVVSSSVCIQKGWSVHLKEVVSTFERGGQYI